MFNKSGSQEKLYFQESKHKMSQKRLSKPSFGRNMPVLTLDNLLYDLPSCPHQISLSARVDTGEKSLAIANLF